MPAFPAPPSTDRAGLATGDRVPAQDGVLDCRGRPLDCRPGQAHVMGILNVTPDSFSDGGRYTSLQQALDHAGRMVDEGAAILDVGGESTRPAGAAYGAGAPVVGLDEELDRVVPVVEAIARALPHVLISVDTYKGAVAREALRAGAHLVNDVTGLREGVGTARAAADYGAPLVVMHAAGRPGAMPHVAPGDAGSAPDRSSSAGIVDAVAASLRRSVETARAQGVRDVIVDAGFGFGKTPDENLQLVAQTDRLCELGCPVLIGVSRKSTVGIVVGSPEAPAPVGERLYGSLGLAALAVVRGASIVRAHDVRPTVELVRAVRAAEAAGREAGAPA